MKVYIKGGCWKNIEDEILKAAVMKYGKNQWDRIASLLSRKSAKQCKARWYEWLDPSIKKTEWTREEEEKLLHLVKIMPTQWRTIAPIVGRTAYQCIEHFESLLDKYQERGEEEDDPRRMRAGEVDYNSEHKPALPDPIDLDEDEKEMLSEARARMANTMGKKAKRRARERQLEEQRRLAMLKKKRELKAAGVYMIEDKVEDKKKMKRQFRKIDYLREIPFQKRPIVGRFQVQREKVDSHPLGVERSLKVIEGRLRDKEEQEKRKKDKKKISRLTADKLPSLIKAIGKVNTGGEGRMKRSKVVLPKPQIIDKDLSTLAKVGFDPNSNSNAAVTNRLLSSYSATPRTNSNLATPSTGMYNVRTPMVTDTLRIETKNIISMRDAQTPLDGGGKVSLVKNVGEGSDQLKRRMTPNPFKAQALGNINMIKTPRDTPFRDELQINEPSLMQVMEKKNRKAERMRMKLKREKLRNQFKKIAKPEEDDYYFKPIFPGEIEGEVEIIEDSSDILKREKLRQKMTQKQLLNLRTSAVKLNLPRPIEFNQNFLDEDEDVNMTDVTFDEKAKFLINKEMKKLINFDLIHYPVNKKGDHVVDDMKYDYDQNDLLKAEELITSEYEQIEKPDEEMFNKIWSKLMNNMIIDQFVLSDLTREEKYQILQSNYDFFYQKYQEKQKRIKKMKKKVNVLTQGYINIANNISGDIYKITKKKNNNQIKLDSYLVLSEMEEMAGPKRINHLEELIKNNKEFEESLQHQYDELANHISNEEVIIKQS